ncbi:RagB/SusD family nutrient uptake outer membrane protein [Arcticibacter eurypsychrophilus]|uniref:RagB/SusD family nutrient uptake outer membrane protein n=1 Tax=Arcticibacter eurypsychrophilus TaxID=1434752 RepID=UPI00084DE627|nr:RagB/SusD family nutrient uptake outer membrane protein [Arcticibacter eurypsychrophilus]
MKNSKINKLTILFLTIVCVMGTVSCKKMLDLEPENQLDVSQAYRNVADADAAVIGVYGKFLELGKNYIMLNEVRADLMDVTANADPYLRELSNHSTISKANPYVDPRPFYEVILNCNDVMKNFDIMLAEHRMSVADYNMRYSDIGALRSWMYLQLGIHYGSVPYITKPLETIDDLAGLADYPKISFDELVTQLITFTEGLPYIQSYAYPAGSSLVVTVDGSNTNKVFVNKLVLLGDLYLWKNEYLKAATKYKALLETESNNSNINVSFNVYRIGVSQDVYNFAVSYARGQEEGSLVYSLTSGWKSMFALPNTSSVWNVEWVWAMPYNAMFKPGNPFIEIFSLTQGKYSLKPSQVAINNWNSQTQFNGIPYDARGVMSYDPDVPGKPEITKFTDNSVALTSLNKGGSWNISRAAGVHLHYIEAANRDGQGKLSYALLNRGIANTYSPNVLNNSPTLAQVDSMQTPYPTSSPYYFDARNSGGISSDFRKPWHRNAGIRGRANIPALPVALQTNMLGLEDKVIDEAALELAFEGSRWSDLLRIALRREKENAGSGKLFLKDKIAAKFIKGGLPVPAGVTALGNDVTSWYLPFK